MTEPNGDSREQQNSCKTSMNSSNHSMGPTENSQMQQDGTSLHPTLYGAAYPPTALFSNYGSVSDLDERSVAPNSYNFSNFNSGALSGSHLNALVPPFSFAPPRTEEVHPHNTTFDAMCALLAFDETPAVAPPSFAPSGQLDPMAEMYALLRTDTNAAAPYPGYNRTTESFIAPKSNMGFHLPMSGDVNSLMGHGHEGNAIPFSSSSRPSEKQPSYVSIAPKPSDGISFSMCERTGISPNSTFQSVPPVAHACSAAIEDRTQKVKAITKHLDHAVEQLRMAQWGLEAVEARKSCRYKKNPSRYSQLKDELFKEVRDNKLYMKYMKICSSAFEDISKSIGDVVKQRETDPTAFKPGLPPWNFKRKDRTISFPAPADLEKYMRTSNREKLSEIQIEILASLSKA